MPVKKILMLAALLTFSSLAPADPYDALGVQPPKVRLTAPDFTLTRLDGEQIRLSDYSGNVVLLNFWATWCAPCREEMPGMEALYQRYKQRGLEIVAVSADQGNMKQVEAFVTKLKLTFPILKENDGEVRQTYEVVGLPMSYLIGRDGKISGRIIGAKEWNSPEAFELIEHLLDQPGPQ